MQDIITPANLPQHSGLISEKDLWEDSMKTLLATFFICMLLVIPKNSFAFIYDTHPDACRHITGMSREQFLKSKNRIFFTELTGCGLITNSTTRVKWVAGMFDTYTVADLEQEAEEVIQERTPIPGRFNILYAQNTPALPLAARRKIDIAALQTDSHNSGAIFQFFTGTDCKTRLADGNSSLNGAVSATSGAIMRHHYTTKTDLAASTECFDLCPRSHGYVSLAGMSHKILQQLNNSFNHSSMRIGVHLDTSTAFGMDMEETTPNLVTQIFTTCITLTPDSKKPALEIAKKALLAAYEGTMHAAAVYGEQTTVFTKLRTLQQVFITIPYDGENLSDSEFSAIRDALSACIPLIERYGLDVTLVVPHVSDNNVHTFLESLRELTEDTKGSFKEITAEPTSPVKRKGKR